MSDNYDDDDQPPTPRGWQDVGGYVQYGWFDCPPADVRLRETPGAYCERTGWKNPPETKAERTATRLADIRASWEANRAIGNDAQLLFIAKLHLVWLLDVASRESTGSRVDRSRSSPEHASEIPDGP